MPNLTVLLLALPLTSGCLLPAGAAPPADAPRAPEEQAGSPAARFDPFAFDPVTGDLELAAPEPTVADLITAYGALTGQLLVLDPRAEQAARSLRVPPLAVPAERVQATVEQLLALHGLHLALQPGATPRTVLVGDPRQSPAPAPFVALADLRGAEHHPAVRVATTVTLTHTDPRMLANSMRVFLPDPSLQLVPMGTSTLSLAGPAPAVLHLAALVESADQPGVPAAPGAAPGSAPRQGAAPPQGAELSVVVLALKHHEAQALVEVLHPILESAARASLPGFQGRACQLSWDARSNSIVAALPEAQVEQVRRLVEVLDQPAGEPAGEPAEEPGGTR